MIRTFLSSMILFLLLQKQSSGQASANYIPQTPIAAQYEKYINYPVDHSTGAASITVPLHTIKAAGIEVPVNLSYHTAGVKPSDPSLPVGLGWTINPGARVTRKILGYPDENIPKPPVVKLAEELSPTTDLQYLQNLEYEGSQNPSSGYTDQFDPEYDIFTYSTGTGVTGKFVIKKQGNEYIAVPLIATRDRIKLTPTINGVLSLDYFEITDPNGVYYRFGDPLTSYSDILKETGNYSGISGWMLTDIISADKSDTINFKWTNVRNDAGNWYKQQNIIDGVTVTDKFEGANINPNGDQNGNFAAPGYSDVPQRFSHLSESYSLSTVIESIRYKNEEVKFIYTEGVPTKLENVEIYSNNVRFRKVDFHKSLFGSTSYLRLDSVSIRDKINQVVSRYRFGYNQSESFPTWPHRKLDFWGYYNGQDNNYLIPNFSYQIFPFSSQPYFYSFSSGSRASSSTYAQVFVLNSVVYPTGGKITYEYESNMFKVTGGSPAQAGGLRVKKINHWTGDGQLAETRSYQYGTDGGGDGSPMEGNWYAKSSMICWVYGGGQSLDFPMYRKMVISSEPNETIFLYDYPSVTYRTVTEYIGDPNGNNLGKIVYNYSQSQLLPLHTFLYSYEAYGYLGRYWDNPRLEKTTYYKNNGGSYTPVRYSSTIYNTPTVDTVKSLIVRRYAYIIDNSNPMYAEQHFSQFWPNLSSVFQYGTVYFNYGGPAPAITRNVEFSPSGDSLVTEQNYDYANNDFRYVKSVTSQNSNGNSTTTHFTYPFDYNVGTSPSNTIAQGIKLLQDRNVVAPVIEEYTEVQPGNIVKSGRFTTFKTTQPVPEHTYGLETIPVLDFSPASITSSAHTISSSYFLKSTIDLYDPFGNIRQATDKVGGISTVLLHSYNGQFPIAVIKNASFSSVATALGGETAINNFAAGYPTSVQVNNFLSSIRSSLPKAFINTYTHDPVFGMTSQTNENGRTTYYEYDASGRLTLVRDHDNNILKKICYNYAGQPENCFTYFNVAKSGNFTRNNCASGGTAGTVTYSVDAGTYSSTTSQAAADALAQNDVNTNGQAYANANATCTFYNNTVSNYFTRNNCGSGYIGSSVFYQIAANTYSSTVSQAAANQLAQDALNTNGQANANTNGTCIAVVGINVSNYAAPSGCYMVEFHNTSTFELFYFYISSTGTLGYVPPGTYDIGFYEMGSCDGVSRTFNVCAASITNTGGAYFTNQTINSSTCYSISVQ